jgi:hypothetical protein
MNFTLPALHGHCDFGKVRADLGCPLYKVGPE